MSSKAVDARGKWHSFQVLKDKNCQLVLYQGKIFFRNEGKVKSFLDEGTPRAFVTSRPNFQKMAKESKQKGNYKGRHVGTLGMKK